MKRKGFTLIELLVVIAIIAMLLAILVPSLKKAKAHARRIIEKSDLKALGQAAEIYLTKNDDRFFNYASTSTDPLWIAKMSELIDNIDEIRFCPQTMNKIEEVAQDYNSSAGSKWGTSDRPWLWAASADATKKYEMGSYGLNGWLYANGGNYVVDADKPKCYAKRTDIKIPSKTPIFADANWVDGWPKTDNALPATGYDYTMGDRTGGNSAVTTMIGRFVIGRHGTNTNVVFADSHAETITHAQLWTLSWHKGAQPNFNPVIPKPLPVDR